VDEPVAALPDDAIAEPGPADAPPAPPAASRPPADGARLDEAWLDGVLGGRDRPPAAEPPPPVPAP
jgi:hypothetical protein